MGQIDKLLISVLSGAHDRNIKFSDLRRLMNYFDFNERIKGDHFIYTKEGIDEIINLQPNGNSAKPYQVKQIRNLIIKYSMGGKFDV